MVRRFKQNYDVIKAEEKCRIYRKELKIIEEKRTPWSGNTFELEEAKKNLRKSELQLGRIQDNFLKTSIVEPIFRAFPLLIVNLYVIIHQG